MTHVNKVLDGTYNSMMKNDSRLFLSSYNYRLVSPFQMSNDKKAESLFETCTFICTALT